MSGQSSSQNVPSSVATPLAGGKQVVDRLSNYAASSKQKIYSCNIREDYTPKTAVLIPALDKNQPIWPLSVKKGQEAWSLLETFIDVNGGKWTRVNMARTGETGAVLQSHVNRGTNTDLEVEDQTIRPLPSMQVNSQGSVLERTVSLLYSHINAAKSVLLDAGSDLAALEDLAKYHNQAKGFFLKGMPKDVRQVLDGGNFDFDQLWKLPNNDQNWLRDSGSQRVVIYMILFRDIKKASGGTQHGYYVGKTIKSKNRRTSHMDKLEDPDVSGHMYRRASGAQSKFLILCDLTPAKLSQTARDEVLRILEHTGVCLFRSWTDVLFTSRIVDAGQLSRHYFDSNLARIYTSIVDEVFQKTGFQFVMGTGLNWQTPLSEITLLHTSLTCEVFTPSDELGELRVYRTGLRAIRFYKKYDAAKITLFAGGGDNRGKVYLSIPKKELGKKPPKKAYIVVEIYTGVNKRHPVPWARYPEPGPFTYNDDFNRIGIRVEWLDEKEQWKTLWLQMERGLFETINFSPEKLQQFSPAARAAAPHATRLWIKARCIYDTLMKVEYDDSGEVFPFIKRGPPIDVKVFTYAHMKRKIVITNQKPLVRKPPTLVSLEKNMSDMAKKYGNYISFKPMKGLSYEQLDATAFCVICVTVQRPGEYHNTGRQCEERPFAYGQTCVKCYILRRPCCWLPIADLQQKDGTFVFIRVPCRYLGGVHDSEGPGIQDILSNAATEEEMEDTNAALEKMESEGIDEDDDL